MQSRKLNRLTGFDYSSSGYYFITACTNDRYNYFGNICNATSDLTDAGRIALNCLSEIPAHFKGVQVDEFVVMPNHIHCILVLKDGKMYLHERNAYMRSLQINNIGISKIVQQYKAAVKRMAGKAGLSFEWQKSFYDHIIRNEESYLKIKQYIINNPLKWELDAENPESGVRNRNKYYEEITGYVPPVRKEL